jgi:FtsZ-binding cell division protein ZapB
MVSCCSYREEVKFITDAMESEIKRLQDCVQSLEAENERLRSQFAAFQAPMGDDPYSFRRR